MPQINTKKLPRLEVLLDFLTKTVESGFCDRARNAGCSRPPRELKSVKEFCNLWNAWTQTGALRS